MRAATSTLRTHLTIASIANAQHPARAGSDLLVLYCTGLGALDGTPLADGQAAPLDTLYRTRAKVFVRIGGADVPVQFSGLTPSLVALYQINVSLPASVSKGDAVPVVVTVTDPDSGATAVSNTVTVAIQ